MARKRFQGLFARLDMTPRTRPRKGEDRIRALETDVRDLRSALRELVEVLERRLGSDLDHDAIVGRVSAKRGLAKTARLSPPPTPKRRRQPKPLPMNLP
jgi:hypothetical protein